MDSEEEEEENLNTVKVFVSLLKQYLEEAEKAIDPNYILPISFRHLRDYGLCCFFADADIDYDEKCSCERLLMMQLSYFPNRSYPFGGYTEYTKRAKELTQHLNPIRLQWVRDTIDKLTKELEEHDNLY